MTPPNTGHFVIEQSLDHYQSREVHMPKRATAQTLVPARDSVPALYPDDLTPALQEAMATLADIEARYARERDALEGLAGPERERQRLCQNLENWHREAREPHALRLAELHMRALSLTMFKPTT